jgi:hypothetical protein
VEEGGRRGAEADGVVIHVDEEDTTATAIPHFHALPLCHGRIYPGVLTLGCLPPDLRHHAPAHCYLRASARPRLLALPATKLA